MEGAEDEVAMSVLVYRVGVASRERRLVISGTEQGGGVTSHKISARLSPTHE